MYADSEGQKSRDGNAGFEVGLLIQHGLFFSDVHAWLKRSFDSSVESLLYHYIDTKKSPGISRRRYGTSNTKVNFYYFDC